MVTRCEVYDLNIDTCSQSAYLDTHHTHNYRTCTAHSSYTYTMLTHAPCSHMHHAHTCTMLTHAPCSHMHHAHTCTMLTHCSYLTCAHLTCAQLTYIHTCVAYTLLACAQLTPLTTIRMHIRSSHIAHTHSLLYACT